MSLQVRSEVDEYNEFLRHCDSFLQRQESGSVVDAAEFTFVVRDALETFVLLESELADMCSVGRSTVYRWLQGSAVPMKRTRIAIIQKFQARIEKLKEEKKRRLRR